MAKPHAKKPFPAAFYRLVPMKARHYLCFWCLCNEFETDDDGWINCTKQDFFQAIAACMPTKTHNPTSILETMHELGLIEFQRFNLDKDNRFSTTAYRIRVPETTWNEIPVTPPPPIIEHGIRDRKTYYRNRYQERKNKMEMEKVIRLGRSSD